jgi:DNA repair photolyase
VWLCPILPFLNDTPENVRGIIDYCIEAGVKGIINFGMGLTLRDGNREYFYAALDRHFPGMKEKYIRTYGDSYGLMSPANGELMALFHRRCGSAGIMHGNEEIFNYLNTLESKDSQMSLF